MMMRDMRYRSPTPVVDRNPVVVLALLVWHGLGWFFAPLDTLDIGGIFARAGVLCGVFVGVCTAHYMCLTIAANFWAAAQS